MKPFYLLAVILLLATPVIGLTEYGYDSSNSFSTSYKGGGVMYEDLEQDLNKIITRNPLVYESNIFLTTSSELIKISSNGSVLWTYETGLINGIVLLNDSIIIAGEKSGEELMKLDHEGNSSWIKSVHGGFKTNPIIHEDKIILSQQEELTAYSLNNGSVLWNTSMPLLETPGVIHEQDYITASEDTVYSINTLTGSINFNKLITSTIHSITLNNDVILVNTQDGITALDEYGSVISELSYFYPFHGVDTNIAGVNEFFTCAENGLYSFVLEDNKLYFSNFIPYNDCSNPGVMDFNNDGLLDVVIKQDNDLIILNNSGSELTREDIGEDFHFSISDYDNDNMAEFIITKSGVLTTYDTTFPDNEISLTLTSSGFKAIVENIGYEDSQSASLTFNFENESFSKNINIPSGESEEVIINYTPNITGVHEVNAVINDSKDIKVLNNNISLSFEVINLTQNNHGILYNNTYYNLSNNHSSVLKLGDVNGDGIREFLINTDSNNEYDYVIDESTGYIKLGDLELLVYDFYDEIYDNESIKIRTFVKNKAVYKVRNASLTLFRNNNIIQNEEFNMDEEGTKAFNFTINDFNPGHSIIKIALDYENELSESNEDNNIFTKTVNVEKTPVHELSVLIGLSTTNLHNKNMNLLINNSGGFNETLIINCEPSICLEKNITINKGSVKESLIGLNVSIGEYEFNFTLSNENYYLSELLNLDFNCMYDSDCGEGRVCLRNECVNELREEVQTIKTINTNGSSNNTIDSSYNNALISSMIAASSLLNLNNPLFYWITLSILLIISSMGVYFVAYSFLKNHAQYISITNFLIFLGITLVFEPINIHLILLEEVLISFIIIFLIRGV